MRKKAKKPEYNDLKTIKLFIRKLNPSSARKN